MKTQELENRINELKIPQLKNLVENFCKKFSPTFKFEKFECKIEKRRDSGFKLSVMSNDIKGHLGIFDAILEKCVIDEFASFVFPNKDTSKIEADVDIHLSYKHLDGGMNGMKLVRVIFKDDNWKIID